MLAAVGDDGDLALGESAGHGEIAMITGLSVNKSACRQETRLRVAFFTDSFTEVNGVGTLSREYAACAERERWPLLCVYGGPETCFTQSGSVEQLQLRRGPLAFAVDANVLCDPLLVRHRRLVTERLRAFRPDLVHITGPGDVSTLGFWAANLVGVPVVASWHTNLHEYAERRLAAPGGWLPAGWRPGLGRAAGAGTLWAVASWYRLAHVVAAPNDEMVEMLRERTRRPAYRMAHGVDTMLFSPERRSRGEGRFCIGYVGRLTPEKNVRALVELERALLAAGRRDFRMVLVGEGSEGEWLRANLQTAEFAGVLRGADLARAFADMDVFVFPSLTDTFGLVVLEAMSSGVPVVLTVEAGRNTGVVDGETGYCTEEWGAAVQRLLDSPETARRMGCAARAHALASGWFKVFDDLHRIYAEGLATEDARGRMPTRRGW